MHTRIELTGAADRPRWVLTPGAISPRRLRSATGGDHRVALVAAQALLLAGDRVTLDVLIDGPHELHLVETGGTVAYDMRGGTASWDVRVRLRNRAQLVWHAEPFVVATGADVTRETRAELDDGCRLALREKLVLGRTGETGGALRTRSRLSQAARPLVAEDLDLTPQTRTGWAVLGPHRCLDSVTTVGHRVPEGPGVLQAEGEASIARWVGGDLHRSPIGTVWDKLACSGLSNGATATG